MRKQAPALGERNGLLALAMPEQNHLLGRVEDDLALLTGGQMFLRGRG